MLGIILKFLLLVFALGSGYFMYKINQVSGKYRSSNIWDDMQVADKNKVKQYFKRNLILLLIVLFLMISSYYLLG